MDDPITRWTGAESVVAPQGVVRLKFAPAFYEHKARAHAITNPTDRKVQIFRPTPGKDADRLRSEVYAHMPVYVRCGAHSDMSGADSMPAFATFNDIFVDVTPTAQPDLDEIKQLFYDSVRFMGICNNPSGFTSSRMHGHNLGVLEAAGHVSTINTGPHIIHTGQLVYWDVDWDDAWTWANRQAGPPGKHNDTATVWTTDQDAREFARLMPVTATTAQDDPTYADRLIGKATHTGLPSETLDVLLKWC